MANYYKNNRYKVGIVNGLFIASVGAFIIEGAELLNKYTSYTGWTSTAQEGILFFVIYGVASVLLFFYKRKNRNNIYKNVEKELDE